MSETDNPLMNIVLRKSVVERCLESPPSVVGPELRRALKNATKVPPRHLCTLCQRELGDKYRQDVPIIVPGNPPGNRVDLCLECHKKCMERRNQCRG